MCSSVPSEADRQQQEAEAAAPTPAEAACQYSAWHAQLHRHALRSRVIELPQQFVEYLLADGVFVGDASRALPAAATRSYGSDTGSEEASQQGSGDDDEEEEEEQRDWPELFPDLHREIAGAIDDLGGTVVPKLNWSCPTDAVWVNPNGSLACENAEQVVLLLKSSDRVAHDLELLTASHRQQQQQQHQAADGAQPSPSGASVRPTLVLRKWYDLRPEREWRCFVRGGRLVGVSQRDPTQHYPQLCGAACSVQEDEDEQREGEEGRAHQGPHDAQQGEPSLGAAGPAPQQQQQQQRAGLQGADLHPATVAAGPEARQARDLLALFHAQHVAGAFTSLQHYTFDAYVATTGSVKLVDFNPVGGTTSPLLFEWHELGLEHAAQGGDAGHAREEEEEEQGAGRGAPLVRVVPAASYVQAGHRAVCAMPFDMLGLTNTVESMVGRMQQQRQQ